ncbi:MAG: hypothetical protein QNJ42_14595 [Crocosphaera sp.]|nr:hypothetical protein [Crocosphaera sp.]
MIRVYTDTSVFGGVFDDEFKEETLAFFDLVKEGKFQLVISSVVSREIQPAPEKVKDFFIDIYSPLEVINYEG